MRRPLLDNLDQALLVIWAFLGIPTIVTGWLNGYLLPPLWTGSPLLIQQVVDATFALLIYGLPVIVAARVAMRALR